MLIHKSKTIMAANAAAGQLCIGNGMLCAARGTEEMHAGGLAKKPWPKHKPMFKIPKETEDVPVSRVLY